MINLEEVDFSGLQINRRNYGLAADGILCWKKSVWKWQEKWNSVNFLTFSQVCAPLESVQTVFAASLLMLKLQIVERGGSARTWFMPLFRLPHLFTLIAMKAPLLCSHISIRAITNDNGLSMEKLLPLLCKWFQFHKEKASRADCTLAGPFPFTKASLIRSHGFFSPLAGWLPTPCRTRGFVDRRRHHRHVSRGVALRRGQTVRHDTSLSAWAK